jgi:hypothetical protein
VVSLLPPVSPFSYCDELLPGDPPLPLLSLFRSNRGPHVSPLLPLPSDRRCPLSNRVSLLSGHRAIPPTKLFSLAKLFALHPTTKLPFFVLPCLFLFLFLFSIQTQTTDEPNHALLVHPRTSTTPHGRSSTRYLCIPSHPIRVTPPQPTTSHRATLWRSRRIVFFYAPPPPCPIQRRLDSWNRRHRDCTVHVQSTATGAR